MCLFRPVHFTAGTYFSLSLSLSLSLALARSLSLSLSLSLSPSLLVSISTTLGLMHEPGIHWALYERGYASLWLNSGAKMEAEPSQLLHNSHTISEPAAVGANPGRLMYSHALHLTQGLGSGSYQYPTDTCTYTHSHTLHVHVNPLSLWTATHCSFHTHMPWHTAQLSASACMESKRNLLWWVIHTLTGIID